MKKRGVWGAHGPLEFHLSREMKMRLRAWRQVHLRNLTTRHIHLNNTITTEDHSLHNIAFTASTVEITSSVGCESSLPLLLPSIFLARPDNTLPFHDHSSIQCHLHHYQRLLICQSQSKWRTGRDPPLKKILRRRLRDRLSMAVVALPTLICRGLKI